MPHHFNIYPTVKLIALLLTLFCTACSPYSGQIKRLDSAYASGQIDGNTYWQARSRLEASDQQWRATVAANAQTFSQNMQAQNAQFQENLRQQQAINAYDARTRVLAQPQQVNVSGTIRHDVNARVYRY